jgi:hypothetical protein
MFSVMVAMALMAGPADTLRIRALTGNAPRFDGVVPEQEYGTPSVELPTAQGGVKIWSVRLGDTVFIAARLTDSTFYWGDDFVISLDPLGDRTPGPGHDDTQWYLRRVLDSSVVNRGRHGRWMPPSDDPDWRLGKERSGDGWEVRGNSDATGWSVVLKLPVLWFADDSGRKATIAFRSYDDAPHAWYSWPAPLAGARPTRVEMAPAQWVVVTLEP